MGLIDKKDMLEAVKALPAELDAETVQRCIEVLSNQPIVDAIPVEYIEYEKDRINRFIQIAVKHGDTKEAYRLTGIVAVLDAIISNWRYTTGPDWRAERKEE